MISAFFCDCTQRTAVSPYRRFETTYGFYLGSKCQAVKEDLQCLTLELLGQRSPHKMLCFLKKNQSLITSVRQVKAVSHHGRPNPLKHNIQQVISRRLHQRNRHFSSTVYSYASDLSRIRRNYFPKRHWEHYVYDGPTEGYLWGLNCVFFHYIFR
jgi:Txe/YoeB family toxin of Txe-Axe toxin-antitoxin module